jgi:ATP-dependent DNA ligase
MTPAITYPARPVNGGPFHVALPKSGKWFYEPKYNGWRALVHVPTRTMFNRKGELLSIADEFKPALDAIHATLSAGAFKWVDCEALERRHNLGRGTLIVLDCVPEPEYATTTYDARKRWLSLVVPTLGHFEQPMAHSVYVSPHFAADEAGGLYAELAGLNKQWGCEFYEGLVAKRADSTYPIQRRSADTEFPFWVKHRWQF